MRQLPAPAAFRSNPAPATNPDAVTARQRRAVADILDGADDRLLAVVGPCSVHDTESMVEYSRRLAAIAAQISQDVFVVARVYTEKPRTRHGWPGFLLDPQLDGGYEVSQGIAQTRRLLGQITAHGMPIGCEFVEPMLAPYVADLVCWGAIGARTVESPPHRRLASALEFPMGIKNRSDGAIAPAIDAIAVASGPQPIIGIGEDGTPGWYQSDGNPHAHLVLRGGETGTNYQSHQVNHALRELSSVHPSPRLIVDCSHGNSGKDHRRQPLVAESVAGQVAAGQTGIAGVMLESFLHEGSQPMVPPLSPGISVTDACMGLEQTETVLRGLARSVRHRRAAASARDLVEVK